MRRHCRVRRDRSPTPETSRAHGNDDAWPRPARQRRPARCGCKAGFARAAIPKGASAFSNSTTARRLANIQIIADGSLANYESEIKHLAAGCSVTVEGDWSRPRPPRGRPPRCRPARSSFTAGPIPRRIRCRRSGTRSSSCARSAHLRPRTNTFGAIARVRNCVCRSIHDFFQEEGFLYVHTPIITASDCEGAGEMFKVTTLDLAKVPKHGRAVDYAQDFFDRPAYLTVSGQLRGRDLRLRAGQGLHLRPDVSRRELEHLAPPGRVLDGRAGDGLLRADRQHGPGRAVLEAHLPRRARRNAPRTCSSSTSASTRP